MRHEVTVRLDPGIVQLATRAIAGIEKLLREIKIMAGELDRLATEVSETTTVVGSAVALLNTLGDLIRQNVNDPARLTALADELDQKQAELAAAIAANTLAAPPAP